MKISLARIKLSIALFTLVSLGCGRRAYTDTQGYIEGDFVYVAAPFGGQLDKLEVVKGQQVAKDGPLFTLDNTAENASYEEAEKRMIAMGASVAFSEKELVRQERLAKVNAAVKQAVDQAESRLDQDRANLKALGAAVEKARWALDEKRQLAPMDALVFDTLYRQGEWVDAGRPVVSLLPPQNIKLRAFVSEREVGSIKLGEVVRVFIDGWDSPAKGTVSYISPEAEFTPPVIFSREARSKLVFLVEALFPPDVAVKLHPGQPVDVRFGE